jgi:uncharacterized RDD family membrane protein YckC
VADAWLVWLGAILGLAFLVLLSLAGYAFVGAFLALGVWLASRHASTPAARQQVDRILKHACNRLPVCDCGPENFTKPS